MLSGYKYRIDIDHAFVHRWDLRAKESKLLLTSLKFMRPEIPGEFLFKRLNDSCHFEATWDRKASVAIQDLDKRRVFMDYRCLKFASIQVVQPLRYERVVVGDTTKLNLHKRLSCEI